MVKPNYYYERYETLLLEAQRLSLAEIGTLQLLKWHAWHRWNPDTERFPSLPNDEKFLGKLCNRTRNWQRVRDGVMSVLAVEGDIVYYPPHRKEAENLTRHAERQAAKKTKTTMKPKAPATPMDRAIAKQQEAAQQEQRDEAERKVIQTMNVQPAAPESQQRPWDEAPAAEPGKLVRGLQGHRVVGAQQFDALLKHPRRLKEGDCVMFEVKDAEVTQQAVKVFRRGIGFALQLESGQTLTYD
jgi:hypothetical protein